MKHKIVIGLNTKSLKKAYDDVINYKSWLREKINEFVEKLADTGMEVAEENTGDFKGIQFRVECSDGSACLIGYSDRQLRTWWNKTEGQVMNWDYSPILMAEFGSGVYAEPMQTLEDGTQVGRGTFPTGKQNGLKSIWAYRKTEKSKLEFSSGKRPTMPMLRATQFMVQNATMIAKEVFGG